MRKIRCFLAIKLAGENAAAAQRLIKRLASNSQGMKWASSEGLHLTLKFFGEITENSTYEISKVAGSVAREHEPFQIRLATLGAFPEIDRPRIVWVGVTEGCDKLCALQIRLDDALAEQGYPVERRQYHPHLTLGRAREKVSQQELVSAIKEQQAFDGGTAQIDRLTLFSSELRRSGPIYTVLATCRLGNNQ